MQINFCCEKCELEFTVESKYMLKKTHLSCPNCDQPFASEILSKIIDSTKILLEARAELDDRKRYLDKNSGYSWHISIGSRVPVD